MTAATSAADAKIHKKVSGLGIRPVMLATHLSDLVKWTTLLISNEQKDDIMKVAKPLERLMIKHVSERIQDKSK